MHLSTSGAGDGNSLASKIVVEGLSKRFDNFVANDRIDLTLDPAQVHVLLGENGAGKSTFMNMLYGHLQPDEGRILVGGRPVRLRSPADAIAAGIGLVHQHFSLVPRFSVADNVVLGNEPKGLLYSPQRVRSAVSETVDRLGWNIDLDRPVGSLPVGVQQRVEILKLLHRGARTLLLDEPTALLAPAEIDSLLDVINDLRLDGASVLLVTHKLREIERVANAVTVLRQGRVTASLSGSAIDATQLARAMTGAEPTKAVRARPRILGRPVLEVKHLDALDYRKRPVIHDLSFEVRAGEILGVAAVEGNGQRELVSVLAGVETGAGGRVVLDGREILGLSPRRIRRAGLATIPADRRGEGVVGAMSIAENLALNDVAASVGTRFGVLDRTGIRGRAKSAVESFDIRPPATSLHAERLSGGNMQKLVVARETARSPLCLLASSPTWGLDIVAVASVHARILALRDEGAAILLSSPDLDEVLAISDRVIVLYRGSIAYEASMDDLSFQDLSLALVGMGAGRSGGDSSKSRTGIVDQDRASGVASL